MTMQTWLRLASAPVAMMACALAAPAMAQDADAGVSKSAQPAGEKDGLHLDDIVVTGRLGTTAQKKVEASYSITTLKADEIRVRAINSLADAVAAVPGIWTDTSSGTGTSDTRVRGIPANGFTALAVYEDGLPMQHDPGISWSNVDQFIRLDETYAGIEVVRGGPSSIFASNAPGGLINLLPRLGTPTLSGIAKLTVSDYGQRRGDLWLGGPIADGWRFSVGGFYNKDDGIRSPGYTANEGGQVRAIVSKDFGNGHLEFSAKYLKDHVQYFETLPFTRTAAGDVVAVTPFDPLFQTLTGPRTIDVRIRTPDGTLAPNFDKSSQIDDLQFTVKGDHRFADGTSVKAGFRYRDSDTNRDESGISAVYTTAAYLASQQKAALMGVVGAKAVALRYSDTGASYPTNANGNGLVALSTFQSIRQPLREMIGTVEIGHVFDTAIGRHDVKIGLYGTVADWSHLRNDASVLTEVAPNARHLDAIVTDASGNLVGYVARDGIQRYEAQYAHSFGGYDDESAYIADEWQVTGRLRLDFGYRRERLHIAATTEGVKSYNLGDPTTLADDNVLYGSRVFTPYRPTFTSGAFTAGVNWQIRPSFGIFGRYTDSYRNPQIGQYRNYNTDPSVIRVQPIKQAEGGVKFQSSLFSIFATGFYSSFKGVPFNTATANSTGLLILTTDYADVRTIGLELETELRPTSFLSIAATATVQDPQLKNYNITSVSGTTTLQTSYSGNRPQAMPVLMTSLRPSLNLFGDRLHLLGEWRHEGKKFNDNANLVPLPAFDTFNASAKFDVTKRLSVLVKGSNLTNALGLGRGFGVQSNAATFDSTIFLARPTMGRAVQGSLLFSF